MILPADRSNPRAIDLASRIAEAADFSGRSFDLLKFNEL
jgi:hypothetical protein